MLYLERGRACIFSFVKQAELSEEYNVYSREAFQRSPPVIMLHEELHVYTMPEHAQVQFSGEV